MDSQNSTEQDIFFECMLNNVWSVIIRKISPITFFIFLLTSSTWLMPVVIHFFTISILFIRGLLAAMAFRFWISWWFGLLIQRLSGTTIIFGLVISWPSVAISLLLLLSIIRCFRGIHDMYLINAKWILIVKLLTFHPISQWEGKIFFVDIVNSGQWVEKPYLKSCKPIKHI